MNHLLRLKQISRLTTRFNRANHSKPKQIYKSNPIRSLCENNGLKAKEMPKETPKPKQTKSSDTVIWVTCGGLASATIVGFSYMDDMYRKVQRGKYKRSSFTDINKFIKSFIMPEEILKCQTYIMENYKSNNESFKEFLEDYPIDFDPNSFLYSTRHYIGCKFYNSGIVSINNKKHYGLKDIEIDKYSQINRCTCSFIFDNKIKNCPYAIDNITSDFIDDYGDKMNMKVFISSKFPQLSEQHLKRFVLDKYSNDDCKKIIGAYLNSRRKFSKKFVSENRNLIIESYGDNPQVVHDFKTRYNYQYNDWIEIIGMNPRIDAYIIDQVLKPSDTDLAMQIYKKYNMNAEKLKRFTLTTDKVENIITKEEDSNLKGFAIAKLKPVEIIKIFKESDDPELLNAIYMSSHKYIPPSVLKIKISKIKSSNIISNPPHGDCYDDIYKNIVEFYMKDAPRRKTFFNHAKINGQMLNHLPADTLTDKEWEKILKSNNIKWKDISNMPRYSESEELREKLINMYTFDKTEILPDDVLKEFSSKLLDDINVAPVNKRKIINDMDKPSIIDYIKKNPKSGNVQHFADKLTMDDMKSNKLLFNEQLLICKYDKKEIELDDLIDVLEFSCKTSQVSRNNPLSLFENHIMLHPDKLVDICKKDIRKINRFMKSNINNNVLQKLANEFVNS